MRKFDVTGMTCAACSARVEKAVSALDGVDSCAVNLLTNSMTVEGDASNAEIISAVKKAGYGAKAQGEKGNLAPTVDAKKEARGLIIRLASSCAVLAGLMYISMGHVMWGAPLPRALSENPLAIALLEMILAAVVMLINNRFFVNGTKGLINRSPNMDTLVALGSGAAFVYSTYMLFKMTAEAHDHAALHSILHGELYFESAAMILTLITVGKMLEARAKGKTTSAIESLIKLAPKVAHRVNADGSVEDISAADIKIGDRFCVFAGESIPTDADIVSGNASIDESMLTGESMPVDKTEGVEVYGGTVTRSGYIECVAKSVGEDTMLSGIIKMVSDATATKAPIAKIADKVSGIFVPCVLGISLITVIVWLFVSGMDVGYSLARGISVLVISCPCALGLATPVAIMVGSGVGAKNGILFKDAAALENIGRANIVLLDKTGTVTEGKPRVTDVFSTCDDEDKLLSVAYALESKSEHPLAHAIVEYARGKGIELREIEDFKTLSGNGVEGALDGKLAFGGSIRFVSGKVALDGELLGIADRLADEGKTPVAFVLDGEAIGIIGIADSLRPESAREIEKLKAMGIFTVMLTGDNKKTADAIGSQCGVDYVISDVLPAQKGDIAREMKKFGKVVMVGDGINDAVALTVADVGVAIGAGSHIAMDAASVVLIGSGIGRVGTAIRLGKKTLTNIKENLFWAFAYNTVGIPLAAGAFVALLGWDMSPMLGALAMSLSSFCVVSNALRLNFVNLNKKAKLRSRPRVDISAINQYFMEKERKKKMEITIKVGGMMCPHCEARVKKCLEENANILSAEVSHKEGYAKAQTNGNITRDEIAAIITSAGYEVLG